MKDLIARSISSQFIVKVYGITDNSLGSSSISTDQVLTLGEQYKELNIVRVSGYDTGTQAVPAQPGTLLVLPGKGVPVQDVDPFGETGGSCWTLPRDAAVGNIEITSSVLDDLVPQDYELDVLATRLQIKDYSYEDGRLKARIEWELSAGPFSYSDYVKISLDTSLGRWTKVGQVGPVKVYVKLPKVNKICAKAEARLGWPVNRTLRASECVHL